MLLLILNSTLLHNVVTITNTILKCTFHTGTMNVLKRNYKLPVLQETNTSFSDLELFVQYLLSSVLPSLEDLTPNLLTLPFILDLVLKNKNTTVPTVT